jgi:hypothetical protein
MDRRQKILASAALPAVLAIGVATGVAFAQMPDDGHHNNRLGATDMNQMMQSSAMQDHMKEVLGEEAYARMLQTMGEQGAGMPMAMGDMDTMMTAMAACLGTNGEMPGGAASYSHSEHHPTTTAP